MYSLTVTSEMCVTCDVVDTIEEVDELLVKGQIVGHFNVVNAEIDEEFKDITDLTFMTALVETGMIRGFWAVSWHAAPAYQVILVDVDRELP